MQFDSIKNALKKGLERALVKTGLKRKPRPAHGIFIPPPTMEDTRWAARLSAHDIFQASLEMDLINAVEQKNIWRVNHVLNLPKKFLFLWERKIDPSVTITRGFIDVSALGLAAEKGTGDIVRLLAHYGCDANRPMTSGITPLHAAAWHGNKETAAALVASGAKTDAQADNGQTPLMLCAWNGYYELADMLVNLGARPDLATGDGKTALHIAADVNRPNFIRRMAKLGADINAHDAKGETPLMRAARRGHTAAVEALLDSGALSGAVRRDGQNALSLAVTGKHADTVDILLSRRDYDPEETASLAGISRSPAVRLLLEAHVMRTKGGWRVTGQDEIQHVSINPQTGLHLTDSFNFTTQERVIVTQDAKTGAQGVIRENFSDLAGSPALDEASRRLKAATPSPTRKTP